MSEFDRSFPLPFRIATAIVAGVWGWGLNLKGFQKFHIDSSSVLQYSISTSTDHDHNLTSASSAQELHPNQVYKLAGSLSVTLALCLLVFSIQGDTSIVLSIVPWFCLVAIFAQLFSTRSPGRSRLVQVALQTMRGSIDKDNRLPFILLADALTSYSKVLVDLVLALLPTQSMFDPPDRSGMVIVPIVSAIPFVIRLSQCYMDFSNTNQSIHLLNMAKYATSLPMIFMAAVVKNSSNGDSAAFKLWCLAAFINSSYSYIWDIRCDWDLALLGHNRHGGLLRPVLFFESKAVYYSAVGIDLVLRFLWVFKSLYGSDTESEYYALILVEIGRRWMWVFFRVEAEWASSSTRHKATPLAGM